MKMLFLGNWLSQGLGDAIYWTLVHSLWQGLIASALAGLIIISTGRSPARIRYNLLSCILIMFVLGTLVTFLYQFQSAPASETPLQAYVVPGVDTDLFVPPVDVQPSEVNPALGDSLIIFLEQYSGMIVFAWTIFFLIKMIKMATGLFYIARLRQQKIQSAGEEWEKKFSELVTVLGIRDHIRLLQSELIKVPVAIGYLKPVILLPLGLLAQLPPEQVETILLHELAHIKRKDYLVNLVQNLAECLFFFNPGLVWISSLLREERESCCDDLVVAHTTHKNSYLEALVSFQQQNYPSYAYTMALGDKNMHLFNRVKRMITRENKKLNFMEKLCLLGGLIIFSAFGIISEQQSDVTEQPISQESKPLILKPELLSTKEIDHPKPAEKPRQSAMHLPKPVYSVSRASDTIPPVTKQQKKEGKELMKIRSSQYQENNNDNASVKDVKVTTEEGKTYRMKKENGKLVVLEIDGKNIPEDKLGDYSDLVENLEASLADARRKKTEQFQQNKARSDANRERTERAREQTMRLKEQNQQRHEINKERNKELVKRRQEIYQRKIENSKRNSEIRKKQIENNRKRTNNIKQEKEEQEKEENIKEKKDNGSINKKNQFNKNEVQFKSEVNIKKDFKNEVIIKKDFKKEVNIQNKSTKEENNSDEKEVEVENDRVQSGSIGQKPIKGFPSYKVRTPVFSSPSKSNLFSDKASASYILDQQRVRNLIADLVKEKVIGHSADVEWFAISSEVLMVNGKKLPSVLHQKLKQRYGIRTNYGLYYGPVKMYGKGIHMDKVD